jgi:hypothetical protein
LKISACLSFLALGLQANRPDEAGEFSGHGDASLVDLHPTRSQCRKPTRQPQLRLPSRRSDRLRQRFLAGQRFAADSSLEAIVPGRFGQEPARVRVSRLGDAAAAGSFAARALRRDQAEIAHELARMREAREVADLGHQADRRDRGHSSKCLQCTDRRLEAPAGDRALQRLRQPLDTVVGRLDCLPILGERRLRGAGKLKFSVDSQR